MSCGSTACNSTNNLEPASPSFPDLRWLWKIPLAWLARTALGWERRYQRRQLLKLDDRLLGDIGYRLNMSDSKSGGAKPATSVIAAKETTMNMRTVTLIAALCTTAAWAPARAQTVETSVVKVPQDIVYKGLPGAPQHVTLYGDSSQPGLYVDRIRFLPGMKVMPHWHPDTVRTVLVMSGTFYFAVGEQWDESKLMAYPAGTLYSEPPRTPHYAWAKDGEVILQITAIGPTGNVAVAPNKP